MWCLAVSWVKPQQHGSEKLTVHGTLDKMLSSAAADGTVLLSNN